MAIQVTKIRPRMPDVYDPEGYSWIVELGWQEYASLANREMLADWFSNHAVLATTDYLIWGTRVSFTELDAAMLFYLAYA